jgi:hypothetical protein
MAAGPIGNGGQMSDGGATDREDCGLREPDVAQCLPETAHRAN